MTEQYGQRSINNPEGSRFEANTAASPGFVLTASDTGKLVILDTSLGGPGTAVLPRAAEAGAGAEITIVAPDGAANPLTVAPITAAPPDVLVEPASAPSNPTVESNGSIIVRSDGENRWYVVGGIG